MIAVCDVEGPRFLLEQTSTPNARTSAAIRALRKLLPEVSSKRGAVFVQYDDFAHSPLCSVAFGKVRGGSPAIRLIPDAFFLESDGYEVLRRAVAEQQLPSWDMRQDIVFWRGSASTRGVRLDGGAVTTLADVPRVALCLTLREVPRTDAAIIAPWGFDTPPEQAIAWLSAQLIFRSPVPPLEQAAYRFLIDIDGVANAWGFFEKLLLGSCILKIASPYEQWFYPDIEPWVHYVPVKQDLSDLTEKISWCRSNSGFARAIARSGQQFALGHTAGNARRRMVETLQHCFIPF